MKCTRNACWHSTLRLPFLNSAWCFHAMCSLSIEFVCSVVILDWPKEKKRNIDRTSLPSMPACKSIRPFLTSGFNLDLVKYIYSKNLLFNLMNQEIRTNILDIDRNCTALLKFRILKFASSFVVGKLRNHKLIVYPFNVQIDITLHVHRTK